MSNPRDFRLLRFGQHFATPTLGDFPLALHKMWCIKRTLADKAIRRHDQRATGRAGPRSGIGIALPAVGRIEWEAQRVVVVRV